MTASHPLVGVVLGSASDAPYAQTLSQTLASFGIPHEVTITSAHRTPDDTVRYARNAAVRGIKVLICAAGLSAALRGSSRRIRRSRIGFPFLRERSADSMRFCPSRRCPRVPVASVGIGGAKNRRFLRFAFSRFRMKPFAASSTNGPNRNQAGSQGA